MHLQNHDNEPNITHAEEIKREQLVAPLSYTRAAPAWADGEGYGPGTYWVPVSPPLRVVRRVSLYMLRTCTQVYTRNTGEQECRHRPEESL